VTLKAREVLDDCRFALREFRTDPMGQEFRVRWVAAVTLLRAVGHVLRKVDGESSPRAKEAVRHAWERLPKDDPLWRFIDDERNNVLKEYGFGAGQGVAIHVSSLGDGIVYGVVVGSQEVTYVMNSGPFKGRDPRDLIEEGLRLWETVLEAVETDIAGAGADARQLET